MPQYPEAIPTTDEEKFLAGVFVSVDSTYCTAIAFFPDRQAIGVRYSDGQEWAYFPFTRSSALSLWNAPSRGKWLWTYARRRGTVHQHTSGAARAR